MLHLSADAKHAILLEYIPGSRTHGFAALARRHGVKGGRWVIARWHERWDGSAASLEEQPHSGRPRTLSSREVNQHIRVPILDANRAHAAVHYSDLLPSVRLATGRNMSLRTVQRYGKEELGARDKRTRKRTADERE